MARRTLKIAVVRPYLTMSKGGAERYALELITALSAAGHRVHAYAHAWDQPELPGVTYTKIFMPRKPAWLRVLCFHLTLRRKLRPAEFDVVLGMTPFWPQHVFWLGDGLYRVWLRIAWPFAPLRRLMTFKRAVMAVNLAMEKKMLSAATSGFIANSKLVARQAQRLYGVRPDRIRIIYPWIDTARFHPEVRTRWRGETRRTLGLSDDETMLLFASNNFKRKGLAPVLQALARIDRAKRMRLMVAGAGSVNAFARLAKRLGVADQITFLGPVGEIERYYGAADGFVLPTQYDPCAAVCLEAMACGLPVITTAMNGAAELIDEGESGFVLPQASVDALARSMASLLDDGWRSRAGLRAAESVRSLSRDAQAARLCAALESFTRSQAAPAVVPVAGDLQANEAYLPLLQSHRLTSFTALLNAAKQHQIDYNQNKRIGLIGLQSETSHPRFFVKAHRQNRSWAGLLAMSAGAGAVEWRNILALQNAGIPTADPVAVGERVISDGSRESFVMTLCLDDHLPADQYVATRFVLPLSTEQRREKIALSNAIADLAARMHARGFHHRDFYLCHIFVSVTAAAAPGLKLIDLQRVGRNLFMARRWIIKDLAQLHYSSLDLPISDRDRLRFFARYRPATEGRNELRRMLRAVIRKSRAIAQHDAKLRAGAPAPAGDPFTLSRVSQTESARRDERV